MDRAASICSPPLSLVWSVWIVACSPREGLDRQARCWQQQVQLQQYGKRRQGGRWFRSTALHDGLQAKACDLLHYPQHSSRVRSCPYDPYPHTALAVAQSAAWSGYNRKAGISRTGAVTRTRPNLTLCSVHALLACCADSRWGTSYSNWLPQYLLTEGGFSLQMSGLVAATQQIFNVPSFSRSFLQYHMGNHPSSCSAQLG